MQMHPKERLCRVILTASWFIAIHVGQYFPEISLAYSDIFLKGPSRSIIYGQIFWPPHPHPHITSLASIYHQNQLSFVFRFSFHLTIHFGNAGNICNKYDLYIWHINQWHQSISGPYHNIRIFIKWKWTPLLGYMQAIHQFTMGRYMLQISNIGELVNGLSFQWFCLETVGKHMKNYVTFSEAALLPQPFPENSLRFRCFQKFPGELGKFPAISLIFHGKAIFLPLECVGTLANSGGRYSIYDVHGIAVPSPAIYGVTVRSRWPTRIRKWQLCFEQ